MTPEIVAAVVSRARLYRDEMAHLLAELVRIPSRSGEEAAIARRVELAMAEAGFEEVRVDGLGSVLGTLGHGVPRVAMDAHMDTVDVGDRERWQRDPFCGAIADGKVWGRGAADQKGGLAALLYAGRIVRELELTDACTLTITGTVMEEDCDGLCWQHLIREEGLTPDVCVLTEPTGCRVYRGQRGRMEMRLEVRGVSAHGSAPERGANAIYRIAEIVRGVETLAPQLADDAFLGRGSIAVTHIAGAGPSLCAIPDQAHIHLDRRLTWGETRALALAEIEAIVAHCAWAREPGAARLTVPRYERPAYTGKLYPGEAFFPAWKLEADHPAVRAALRVEASLAGLAAAAAPSAALPPARWTFSTNGVAICGEHGIPCVGFGPGHEEQAHAADEYCPIDHLMHAAAFYALFPLAFAQASE